MGKKAAVMCAFGLGDGLMYSVVSHNLARQGYDVTTYCTQLLQLQPWIATHTIASFPEPSLWLKECEKYDLVVIQSGFRPRNQHPYKELVPNYPQLQIIEHHKLNAKQPLIHNLVQNVLIKRLGLENPTFSNGMIPDPRYHVRQHPKRIVIHPTSADFSKDWPRGKFFKVAQALRKKGYDPVFIVSPQERPEWESAVSQEGFALPLFPTLTELAGFLMESGYMIGNCSGIGHLSSYLGLPTITLHGRARRSLFWQPGWSVSHVITALPLVPGRHLRHSTWKELTFPFQVLRTFKRLVTLIDKS